MISTVAGTLGVAGSSGNGGYASGALFSNPIGVASDGAGTISSTPSQSPSATPTPSSTLTPSPTPSPNPYWITLAAGTPGVAGFAGDGLPGSSGRLSAPFQVTADGLGGVVIGEVNNNLVRRLWGAWVLRWGPGKAGHLDQSEERDPGLACAANGTLATLWSGLAGPYGGAAPDGAGGFFVADTGNVVLRRISASGATSAVPGYSGSCFGLCPDGFGGVFIADTLANNSGCRRAGVAG